jgi:hypothetical protein
VKVLPGLGVALVSLSLVACGGASSKPSAPTTASTSQSTTATSADTAPPCNGLTATDFKNVGASAPPTVERLANNLGQHRTCADLFIDASGGLVVELTKTPGGPRELAAARETARGQSRNAHPRPLPGIRGGFLIGQQAGFLDHGQVVVLNGGYTTAGQPELTTAQLVALAAVVAHQ